MWSLKLYDVYGSHLQAFENIRLEVRVDKDLF